MYITIMIDCAKVLQLEVIAQGGKLKESCEDLSEALIGF